MTRKDMPEFTKVLTGLAGMFEKQLSELVRDMYFDALSDLSIEQIKEIGRGLARTSTFFPKPVDFRNALAGDTDTKAVSAWEKVIKAKSTVGSYGSVKFDDAIIHSVLSMMGGWVAVCRLEGFDTEKWQRHEFEKSYKALSKTNMQHPEHLLGAEDIDNKAKGYVDRIKEPVLIEAPMNNQRVIEG